MRDESGVHLTHCYQGEYEGSCKYGDEDCPAKPKGEFDHPFEAILYSNICHNCRKEHPKPPRPEVTIQVGDLPTELHRLRVNGGAFEYAVIEAAARLIERAKRAMEVGTEHSGNPFYDGIQAAADFILNNADDCNEFAYD